MAKTGRKTKYKPEFCQMLIDFFDIEPWEEREIPHYEKGHHGEESYIIWTDIKRLPVRRPTLRGFAKTIGISIRAVYEWVDPEHRDNFQEEFAHAFTCAKEIRKEWLIDVGLMGIAPPASFKFVAVNETDMRDKQETVHDVSDNLAELLSKIPSTTGVLPCDEG